MWSNVRSLDRGVVEVVKVIDYGDASPIIGDQSINEMASNKPRSASDKDVVHGNRKSYT
jgi:hypothetical protein